MVDKKANACYNMYMSLDEIKIVEQTSSQNSNLIMPKVLHEEDTVPYINPDEVNPDGISRPDMSNGAEFSRRVEAIANGEKEITIDHLKRERIERNLAKQAINAPDLEKMDKDSENAFKKREGI